ncbi:MAG: Ig-like domain-containing protein [Roseburia sp.]|nr:Ig-like domain-containing protein [Roseburia sp.]
MKRKLLLALTVVACALCCALCLTACNGGSDTVAVESVTLSQTTLTLEIDGTETLTATVAPDNATDKTVTWSSSAPTVATVDNAGKVTAKAEGTATITATTANDKTATCAVTVNAPSYEVTAAEWTQIFNTVSNYTFETPVSSTRTLTIKIDGDKRSIYGGRADGSGQDVIIYEDIYVKDGENYYLYTLGGATCTRSALQEDDYLDSTQGYAQILKNFKDDHGLFTYADGKYTAASIDKTSTMGGVITNAEVTFKNGDLTGLTFYVGAIKNEFKDIGTTTVTPPTVFTESNS